MNIKLLGENGSCFVSKFCRKDLAISGVDRSRVVFFEKLRKRLSLSRDDSVEFFCIWFIWCLFCLLQKDKQIMPDCENTYQVRVSSSY